jgi:hypothetical protein
MCQTRKWFQIRNKTNDGDHGYHTIKREFIESLLLLEIDKNYRVNFEIDKIDQKIQLVSN